MAKGDKHVGSTDQVGNRLQETERAVTGDKLDLRKKMGTITMVTPPSFFHPSAAGLRPRPRAVAADVEMEAAPLRVV